MTGPVMQASVENMMTRIPKTVVLTGAVLLALVWLGLVVPSGGRAADPEGPGVDEREVEAVTKVKEKYKRSLLKVPGTVGVGVGLTERGDRIAIHVYVLKWADKSRLPKTLDGVPVQVIETEGFRAHDGPPGTNHRAALALPVRMGVSSGNVNGTFAGTLGFRVHRIGHPTEVGYITNNHVAAASGNDLCPSQLNPANMPAFGVDQCQPGLLDSPGGACVLPAIGDLVQTVPLVMGEEFVNTVDAAFVRSSRGCVSKNILDIGAPRRKAAFPKLGQKVAKSGRTTGFTEGLVVAIHVEVSVDYGTGCGTALFANQAIVAPLNSPSMSAPGDSGSPVLKGKTPVGLNFAGGSGLAVVTPLPLVLNALGVEIDSAEDEPPPVDGTCP